MNDTPSNNDFDKELQNYRNQIDAIDSALFELILRRSDIVQQVGTLKDQHDSTHIKLRPAREAAQLKSIYEKFSESPFPEAAALMIWRHLINGSLMIEDPLRVLTLRVPQALPDYAREYFGCYADMDFVEDSETLLEKLEKDEADVGIFALPTASDSSPWWLKLADADCKLKIFLKFPFLPTACVRDGLEAVAISKVADEASDESHTALVLQISASVSPPKLKDVVTSVLGNITWHSSNKLADESAACLITVPYRLEKSDDRLAQIHQQLGDEENTISVVGHFAEKLGE